MKLLLFAVHISGPVYLDPLLAEGHRIACLVMPKAFRDQLGPLVARAEAGNIPFEVVADVKAADFRERVQTRYRPDLMVCTGFAQRFPEELMSLPRLGAINVHPSLLPKYRGPDPFFWVLANGERETGVTIHYMDREFDTGDILAQEALPIRPFETMGTLYGRLAQTGADLLVRTLARFSGGPPAGRPQDESQATHNKMVPLSAFSLDCRWPAAKALAWIRAANPFYGMKAFFGDTVLTIWEAGSLPLDDRTRALRLGDVADTDGRWVLRMEDALLVPMTVQAGYQFFGSNRTLLDSGFVPAGSVCESGR